MNVNIYNVKRVIVYLMLALMVCVSGCKGVKDIKVTSVQVESVNVRGVKGLDVFLKVCVDNPAKQVKISEIEGVVKHSGKVIGKLAMDSFILGARTTDAYTLKLKASLAQGSGFKELMVLASPDGLDDCTIDFSAKATYGKGAAMPIKMKDIPLKELLDKIENEKN